MRSRGGACKLCSHSPSANLNVSRSTKEITPRRHVKSNRQTKVLIITSTFHLSLAPQSECFLVLFHPHRSPFLSVLSVTQITQLYKGYVTLLQFVLQVRPIFSGFDASSCIHPRTQTLSKHLRASVCSGPSVTADRAFQRTSGPRRKEATAGPSESRLKKGEGPKKQNSSIPETIKG